MHSHMNSTTDQWNNFSKTTISVGEDIRRDSSNFLPPRRSNVIVSPSQIPFFQESLRRSNNVPASSVHSYSSCAEEDQTTTAPKLPPIKIISPYESSTTSGNGSNDNQVSIPHKTDKDKDVPDSSLPHKDKFSCHLCDKKFKHESYFNYHLRTHTGERPFECTICPKRFFERSKLNRHMSSCHNIKTGMYEDDEVMVIEEDKNCCPHCQKTFARESGLQVHLMSHEGSRPYKCTKCDRSYSGITALKNHEKSHEGVKDILCEICGKAFLLHKYLNTHLRTTHREQEKTHKCPRCRKAFYFGKDLKRHLKMHSNNRQYACKLCQTAFKRRDNLNRHLKLTHLLATDQISRESAIVTDVIISPSPNLTRHVSRVQQHQLPPPLNHPVSVIRSTHDVIMSISRKQQ